MRYLCLVYHEEAAIDALPKGEYDAMMAAVLAYRDELRRGGHYILSSPLEYAHTATTVRVRDGKVSITDGPFAETKEQLGGFYLIDVKDLDEAIEVAKKIPSVRYGTIEIRPLVVFE